MKNFEAGSALTQRDYTKQSNRGLIITAALCVLALAAFVVPLLM